MKDTKKYVLFDDFINVFVVELDNLYYESQSLIDKSTSKKVYRGSADCSDAYKLLQTLFENLTTNSKYTAATVRLRQIQFLYLYKDVPHADIFSYDQQISKWRKYKFINKRYEDF